MYNRQYCDKTTMWVVQFDFDNLVFWPLRWLYLFLRWSSCIQYNIMYVTRCVGSKVAAVVISITSSAMVKFVQRKRRWIKKNNTSTIRIWIKNTYIMSSVCGQSTIIYSRYRYTRRFGEKNQQPYTYIILYAWLRYLWF
jgi:hypothetical protein